MKRIMAAALVVACVGLVGAYSQRQTILNWNNGTLVLTEQEAERLRYRLRLEARIQDIKKRIEVLRARYEAIPDGSAYHRPWASLTNIKSSLEKCRQDPRFLQSKKCLEPNEETKNFCQEYTQLKSDEYRWYSLTRLSVAIRALENDLVEAQIEVLKADDPVKSTAQQQLMKYARRA